MYRKIAEQLWADGRLAKGISESELQDIEEKLKLKLPDSYKNFMRVFGSSLNYKSVSEWRLVNLYPDILSSRQEVKEELLEDGVTDFPFEDDVLFVGIHDDGIYVFVHCDGSADPDVYMYDIYDELTKGYYTSSVKNEQNGVIDFIPEELTLFQYYEHFLNRVLNRAKEYKEDSVMVSESTRLS